MSPPSPIVTSPRLIREIGQNDPTIICPFHLAFLRSLENTRQYCRVETNNECIVHNRVKCCPVSGLWTPRVPQAVICKIIARSRRSSLKLEQYRRFNALYVCSLSELTLSFIVSKRTSKRERESRPSPIGCCSIEHNRHLWNATLSLSRYTAERCRLARLTGY